MKYSISSNGSGPMTVTALDNGLVMIADRNHPHFEQIVERAREFEKRVCLFVVPEAEISAFRGLFDTSVAIEELFRLTDRVSLQGTTLFFDGEPVETVLANHVIRALDENLGEDAYMPFIRFWERVQANPTEHARENLMRWLMAAEFTVTDEGYIVAYKGVSEKLRSIHAGPGIVNGVPKNGNLKNKPGNVVEMDRDAVTFDPYRTCAEGLHVGTWDFASKFGPKVVEVWVDPADVVSVPADANGAKMRVCKYTVKRVLNDGYSFAVLKTEPKPAPVVAPVEDEDDEDVVYCNDCGDVVDTGDDRCEYCSEECDGCGYHPEDCECCSECGEENCDGFECADDYEEPDDEDEDPEPNKPWWSRS
jgi:hypothetical protein